MVGGLHPSVYKGFNDIYHPCQNSVTELQTHNLKQPFRLETSLKDANTGQTSATVEQFWKKA